MGDKTQNKPKEMNNMESVIISMTEDHNKNDIYNRMVGVPNNLKNRNFMKNIVPGTIIYINYKGIGISKIVESIDYPYVDNTPIEEWGLNNPEKYSLRIQTKLIVNINNPITPKEVQDIGVKYVSTGTTLPVMYAQQSIIPISEEDGYKITRFTSVRYWNTIPKDSRIIHLHEIADWVTEALGDEGIAYLDTTNIDLPNEWYYNDLLLGFIEEGRDIMNSLGIKKLQIPRRYEEE